MAYFLLVNSTYKHFGAAFHICMLTYLLNENTIVCAQWKRLDETVRLGTYNVNEREVRKYLVFNNKKCLYLSKLDCNLIFSL